MGRLSEIIRVSKLPNLTIWGYDGQQLIAYTRGDPRPFYHSYLRKQGCRWLGYYKSGRVYIKSGSMASEPSCPLHLISLLETAFPNSVLEEFFGDGLLQSRVL